MESEDIVTVTNKQNPADQLNKLQSERDKDSIKHRLDMLVVQDHGQSSSSSTHSLAQGSFALWHLLVIANVAFVLGHYI